MRDGDTQNLNGIVDNGVMYVFPPLPPGPVPRAQVPRVSNIISQIPWVTSLMHWVPSWRTNALALRDLGINMARERLKRGSITKDLYYHLVSVCRPSHHSLLIALKSCPRLMTASRNDRGPLSRISSPMVPSPSSQAQTLSRRHWPLPFVTCCSIRPATNTCKMKSIRPSQTPKTRWISRG